MHVAGRLDEFFFGEVVDVNHASPDLLGFTQLLRFGLLEHTGFCRGLDRALARAGCSSPAFSALCSLPLTLRLAASRSKAWCNVPSGSSASVGR